LVFLALKPNNIILANNATSHLLHGLDNPSILTGLIPFIYQGCKVPKILLKIKLYGLFLLVLNELISNIEDLTLILLRI